MTRMSDALRAAAETAPVADVHVSSSAAASQVRRTRMLRTSANGIVGVGAAAIIVVGITSAVANQTGIPEAASGEVSGETGGRDGAVANTADGAMAPGFVGTGVTCGLPFDASAFPTGAWTATAAVGDVADASVPLTVTLTSPADAGATVGAPVTYVLWDGIVVGVSEGTFSFGGAGFSVIENDSADATTDVALVNCWDSTELPAGDYTLVTVTPLEEVVPTEPSEPTEPAEPAPSESAAPDAPVASDDPASSGAADGAGSDAGVPLYVVTPAVPLTIPGEAVKNPFDEYLKATTPDPVITAPADALTSDAARKAYEDAVTTATWNMAPGTHRVVMTSSAKDARVDSWAATYYGCPMEGTTGTFPAQSADLDWLDVTASLPSQVHVSYGWVVDGNPQVSVSVRNTSPWSLPGFYGGYSPALYLVKDGRVVAEAYPVSVDRDNGAWAYAAGTSGAETQAAAREATDAVEPIIAPAGDGYLASGDALSGDYLWRDVNGCWTSAGSAPVQPGTYTVLTAQNIYVGGVYAIGYGAADGSFADGSTADGGTAFGDLVEPYAGDDSAVVGPTPTGDAPDIAIAPVQDDWTSFQVWTSLGQVTITS